MCLACSEEKWRMETHKILVGDVSSGVPRKVVGGSQSSSGLSSKILCFPAMMYKQSCAGSICGPYLF